MQNIRVKIHIKYNKIATFPTSGSQQHIVGVHSLHRAEAFQIILRNDLLPGIHLLHFFIILESRWTP